MPRLLRRPIPLLALVASLALAPHAVAADQTTDTSTFALANFLGKTSDPRVCAAIDLDASRFSEIPGSGTLTTRVFLSIRLFDAEPDGRCGEPPTDLRGRSLSGEGGGPGFTLRLAKNGKSAHLSGTLAVTEDDFDTGRVFSNEVRINLAYHCISRQQRTESRLRASDGSSRTTTRSCDAEATGSIRSPDPDTGKQRQFVRGPSVFALIGSTTTQTVRRD